MKNIVFDKNNLKRLNKSHCWSRKMAVKKVEASTVEPFKAENKGFPFFGKSSERIASIERRFDGPPSPKRGSLFRNSNAIRRRDSLDSKVSEICSYEICNNYKYII